MASGAKAVPKIIGSVICTPSTAEVGQSVCIEVRSPDGKPYNNTETEPISINGVLGSKHYVVWNQPGTKTVRVVAGTHEHIEKQSATVTVNKPSSKTKPPALKIRWSPDRPTSARFELLHAPVRKLQGVAPVKRAAKTAAAQLTKGAVATARKPANLGGGPTQPLHNWNLGVGAAVGTVQANIETNYLEHLDPARAHSVFHVSLTSQDENAKPFTIQRSVVVMNPYYFAKQRGVIEPPVVKADLKVKYGAGAYHASFTVRNPESAALTLNSLRYELCYDSPAKPYDMQKPQPVNITLKPNANTDIQVTLTKAQLPKDAIGVIAHYEGKGPGNLPVRISVHFDVPEHMPDRLNVSPEVAKTLASLAAKNLVADPSSISYHEVARVQQQNAAVKTTPKLFGPALGEAAKAVLGSSAPPMKVMEHKEPPAAKDGATCDPWNLPDNVPKGMYCMPTAQEETKLMPGRFMNAKRGDIILAPGDGSLISAVLNSVTPPQAFSHSGIMTRNMDEITHSTASQDRIMDRDAGFVGGDGIRPDVLKYLWPGVITQSINDAVNKSAFTDPETNKTWQIGGFGTLESKEDLGGVAAQIVPATVVKPDPLAETDAIRQTLYKVADFAIAQAATNKTASDGKSYYSFYSYTDPTTALRDKAPVEAKWAQGKYPSVCSALVWLSVRSQIKPIEGALEAKDMSAGGQINQQTADGLYLYTAEERLAAGEVLYERLKEMVLEATSSLIDTFTDIEDDLANQVLNTFASNWAATDAKDSDKWRQTTDANAVSPQNLTFYDAPHYGYTEPLIYREPRWETVTVYKWKTVQQFGNVTGVVKFQGKPVAGADVQINEKLSTHTAADGTFTIKEVPIGKVTINAQKVEGSNFESGKVSVDIQANQTAKTAINLLLPDAKYRRIKVSGHMTTTDYQFAASDIRADKDIYGVADLSPDSVTHTVMTLDGPVADADTFSQLYLTLDLQPNNSVKVHVKLRVFDSAKADTDDYDEANLDPFVVGEDQRSHWWIYVSDENYGEAWFEIQNTRHQA